MVKDLVSVNQAARGGARSAAVGATPATLNTRIAGAASNQCANLDVISSARSTDIRQLGRLAGAGRGRL